MDLNKHRREETGVGTTPLATCNQEKVRRPDGICPVGGKAC